MSDLNFLDTSGNKITITTPAVNSLAFNTSNTERLRITSAGAVGINQTAPEAQLDVRTDADPANGLISFIRNNTSSGNGAFYGMDVNGVGSFSIGIPDNTNAFTIVDGLGNSGTERFRIHESGAVTKPNNPSFRANRAMNSNYTSTTLNEILPWNVVEFDRTNVSGYGYDTSTYKYRVAVAGVYWFHCAVYTDTNVDVMFDIVKNNNSGFIQRAELRQSGGDDIGNNTIVHCAGISQCAVGDYIYVNNSGGSAIELIGGGEEGYIDFSGYLIG